MSTSNAAPDQTGSASPEEMMSALFAYLVMQQSNMAMMLLGRVPHPETGKTTRDLDAAKLFIDQLEMLAVKTKGNLSQEEDFMLKQNLMTLRMEYVKAADAPTPAAGGEPAPAAPATEPTQPAPADAEEDEHRKKFTKKY